MISCGWQLSLFLIWTATHKKHEEVVVFFRRIWLDWWTISFFSQKKIGYHQYEEAVQQQPIFLFVTCKYCIYIPTLLQYFHLSQKHCFQFAYATQSLLFNWIQISIKKMYKIIVFCFLLLCYVVKWTHWYKQVKSKNLCVENIHQVFNQISCMYEFYFDIIISIWIHS